MKYTYKGFFFLLNKLK